MKNKDRIGSIIFAIFRALVTSMASGTRMSVNLSESGPRLFPRVAGVDMLTCGLRMVVTAKSSSNEASLLERAGWKRLGIVALTPVLYYLGLECIGFLIMTPVFAFAVIMILSNGKKISRILAMIVVVLTTVILYPLFQEVFVILLPAGRLISSILQKRISISFIQMIALFNPPTTLITLVCIIVGIVSGATSGLSGGLTVPLLLSLTFGTDDLLSFAMMVAVRVRGISGGFTSATLVGIPGVLAPTVTCFDAYPMSRQGETVRALDTDILALFAGTFLPCTVATFLSLLTADFVMKLEPWEYFSLCFCTITLVAALSRGSIFKGLFAAFLGLFLCCVDVAPLDDACRFTFGSIYLGGGLGMVVLMLGVYTIKQVAYDYVRGQQELPDVNVGRISDFGAKTMDITQNIDIIPKSFLIGLWIGFLSRMGSRLSNMMTCAQARSGNKYPETSGKGEPDDIWASECSNNAFVGDALIPMTALGIPGDAVMVLLLSGLMIYGLRSDPPLISSNPQIVYLIFTAVMVSAVFASAEQFFGMRWSPTLLKLPYRYLYGVVLVMCFIGAFISTNTTFNVLRVLAFTVLGVMLDVPKIPASPPILSSASGGKPEEYFRGGVSYFKGDHGSFITRPVSLFSLLMAVFRMVSPYTKSLLQKKRIV